MKPVFIDTSAWGSLADSDDPNHASAIAIRDQIAGRARLVTTNYVLDELYTLLLMNVGHQPALSFKSKIDALEQKGILQVIWISPDLAVKAWSIFERFNIDKHWSFTDCTSFAVMRELGVQDAFAFDRHFMQMGFTCLA